MADGTLKQTYRIVVANAAAGQAQGSVLVEVAYSLNITSLNKAVSIAMSFVRRYQAIDVDAEATVYGQPQGAPSDNPVLAWPSDGSDQEYIYAHIDTPGKGLMQRIALANRDAAEEAAGAALSDDVAPDLAAVV